MRSDQLPDAETIINAAAADLTDAYRALGDAADWLRSDWREGHGPTAQQSRGIHDAFREIAAAKDAINRAKDALGR